MIPNYKQLFNDVFYTNRFFDFCKGQKLEIDKKLIKN